MWFFVFNSSELETCELYSLEVSNDMDLGYMRWLTVRVPGQPGRDVLLELPGPPGMDE